MSLSAYRHLPHVHAHDRPALIVRQLRQRITKVIELKMHFLFGL
jgi:hypothetical protein